MMDWQRGIGGEKLCRLSHKAYFKVASSMMGGYIMTFMNGATPLSSPYPTEHEAMAAAEELWLVHGEDVTANGVADVLKNSELRFA